MRRVGVLIASALAVLAVLSPVLHPADHDSFPVSSYPMFAADRGRIAYMTTAVGIDDAGVAHHLSAETLADTSQPVQASVSVERAVATGDADRLCATIAGRLRGSDLVSVEVYSGAYDAVAYFDGDEAPRERTVHATCEVAP